MLPVITLSTANKSLYINDIDIRLRDINSIKKALGEPSRVEKHTYKTYYREAGYKDMPPSSTEVQITDYYYIYDKLGIIFYTENGWLDNNKLPQRLCVQYAPEGAFRHNETLPFMPKYFFTGTFLLNNQPLLGSERLIPDGVDRNTPALVYHGVTFGLTSRGDVDGLYSTDQTPYLRLFLDNPQQQQLSFLTIQLAER